VSLGSGQLGCPRWIVHTSPAIASGFGLNDLSLTGFSIVPQKGGAGNISPLGQYIAPWRDDLTFDAGPLEVRNRFPHLGLARLPQAAGKLAR
jgi:hypothetical protein